MTRLRANQSRAAASSNSRDDIVITEMDSNGVLVSRPARKVTNLDTEQQEQQEEKEPVITLLGGQNSKAGSVVTTGVNKLKVIHDFIMSNGRI